MPGGLPSGPRPPVISRSASRTSTSASYVLPSILIRSLKHFLPFTAARADYDRPAPARAPAASMDWEQPQRNEPPRSAPVLRRLQLRLPPESPENCTHAATIGRSRPAALSCSSST